ncbi:MAG: hypothetical protein PVI57_20990 [Gemmatimonadota bacterium]|jgi:hypothetical protein
MRRTPPSVRSSAILVAVALALGCSDDGTGPSGNASFPVLRGTVHAVGGGDPSDLWAVWSVDDGAPPDSGRVGADGTFRIETSRAELDGELLVDGPGPREFHPFLHPFDADSLDGVDLLLIPRSWTVRTGTYAGQSVPTPLDPAVDDEADQLLYTYYFGQPDPFAEPVRYLLDLMTWPSENLPARVAIDRANSTRQLSPDDSVAVWAVLEDMEEVFGLDLFEPAAADPDWWPAGTATSGTDDLVPGVIRVVHDPERWGGRPMSDRDPAARDTELGTWATPGRFDAYRESHLRLDGGRLLLGALEPLRLADGLIPWETVLIHEMMHVLGVGHTFRIPSPMGPRMRTAGPSPQDVAYMALLRETIALAREVGPSYGMIPSVIGERRVLLGETALPELEGTEATADPARREP